MLQQNSFDLTTFWTFRPATCEKVEKAEKAEKCRKAICHLTDANMVNPRCTEGVTDARRAWATDVNDQCSPDSYHGELPVVFVWSTDDAPLNVRVR